MPITQYYDNSGGLNITDSPLSIEDNQATGQSYNYDYSRTGAISKVLAPAALNAVADAQLKTLGIHIHHSVSTDVRTPVRCAGTKIQTMDVANGIYTAQSEDTTAAGTDFLNSSSTQVVVSSQFNTASGGTQLWLAGGGMSAIYGYNGTKITKNGVPAPTTSSFTATPVGSGGTFSAGTYRWTLVFRKSSTQAVSNALTATEVSATVVNNDSVTLAWTISNIDTTKYDQILVYRSAISGSAGFTTGSLIAQLASSATGYLDTGASIASAQVIPRAGGTTDNSELSTGTYKVLSAFKRRLCTALNSTVYLSDLNKPESWPISNSITIPTGGPITGLATVGSNGEYTTGSDEYLMVFKENEIWVITGSSIDDWELNFIAQIGAVNQASVVPMYGYVIWLSYNGIYLWDGSGKPARLSRPINAMFDVDGDIDKTKLSYCWGEYVEQLNQIHWRISHRTKGEQKVSIKLDTRLTIPKVASNIENREIDGVFIFDTDSNALYAGCSFKPSAAQEIFLTGDGAGKCYRMYSSASTAVSFSYETKALDMGAPDRNKRFKRAMVLIERLNDNDLTLLYWADYRTRIEYQSELNATTAPMRGASPSLWDIAIWDVSYWDDYEPDIGMIEFNLHSEENNAEGVSLKLRFEQSEALAPVRIHGLLIDWEDLGPVSVPVPIAS